MCTVHNGYDSALWRWHICPFRLLDPVQTETKSFVRTTTDFMSFNNYICSGINLTCVGLFSLFYLTVLFNEKITILFADQFHRLWIFIPYLFVWIVFTRFFTSNSLFYLYLHNSMLLISLPHSFIPFHFIGNFNERPKLDPACLLLFFFLFFYLSNIMRS